MRVLVVDDSGFARKAYCDGLSRQGIDVDAASSAKDAISRLSRATYDVIVSDINMPGMSGLGFLRAIRQVDLDLPVVLTTGNPTVETASEAVEYGAYRYLPKSVRMDVLADTLHRAERHYALAKLQRYALASAGSTFDYPADRAALAGRFDAALENLWIAFQPIVSWPDRRVHGYEVLVRSHEGSLQWPVDLLEAAERLGRLVELGRGIRAQTAAAIPSLPADATVFMNLHPADLNDPSLYDDGPLARVASRIVLEITERVSLDDVTSLPERLIDLRKRGFRLAVDDLGAGYAGLSSMAQIEPEYVKLDMSLIRGIDEWPTKQKLVSSMAHLCDDLGMLVIAEGIETTAERDALGPTGCELLQGYLFAKPESRPPAVRWD